MVTVPSEKTTRVQVSAAPTVYQSSNVPSGAFDTGGAALVSAAGRLDAAGDVLSGIALDMQAEDNEAEIKAKDNEMANAIRSTLYGDGSAENQGYYSSERKAAMDTHGVTEDTINAAIQGVAQNSSNEVVKRKVSELGAVRATRAYDGMARHAGTQREKYLDEVSASREAQALSDSSTDWNDPEMMARSLGIVEGENADYADRHSLDPEVAELKLKESQSAIIKATFDAALANDAIAVAEGMMAKHGDKLTGPIKTEMEEQLKAQSVAVKGQALAASAVLKFPSDPKAAREYIRRVSEGKVEDEAIEQINRQIAEERGDKQARRSTETEKRALDSQARAAANHTYTMGQRNKKIEEDAASEKASAALYEGQTMQEFRQRNPNDFQVLSRMEGKLLELQRIERNVAQGKLFATSSDGSTVKNFTGGDLKQRAEFPLNTVRQNVTPAEWTKLVDRQASAQKQMKAVKEDKSSYSAGRSAIARIAQMPTTAKQTQKQKNMLSEADQEMGVFITSILDSGRKPTQPEVDKKAAEIAINIVSDPWGFSLGVFGEGRDSFEGLSVRAGRMTEAQRASASVPVNKIPPPMNTQINAWLKSWGIESISDGTREEIAGAIAMRDAERVKSLLKEAQ